jgi:hypothetical protein
MTRALLLLLVLVTRAAALTPGGGSTATDCLGEFGGTAPNFPVAHPREIRCTDGDPACDEDPTPGVCAFHVEVCLNVTDASLPSCAHRALTSYDVDNPQPDTNPLHDFDFQTLDDRVNFLTLPLDASDHDVCSGPASMSVPLPVRLRSSGTAVYRRGRKTLRATLGGPAVEDKDKLKMTCVPRDGTLPCDGITSTFQQLEAHVFPTCARSTCHNLAQGVHQMSLAPGEAYASLVGVEPQNSTAAAAGKLRVDPGHPENSFIVDKLRGTLAAGEGERMPRGLRRLDSLRIQLVQDWIAAGAPATGFVSPVGCH